MPILCPYFTLNTLSSEYFAYAHSICFTTTSQDLSPSSCTIRHSEMIFLTDPLVFLSIRKFQYERSRLEFLS